MDKWSPCFAVHSLGMSCLSTLYGDCSEIHDDFQLLCTSQAVEHRRKYKPYIDLPKTPKSLCELTDYTAQNEVTRDG